MFRSSYMVAHILNVIKIYKCTADNHSLSNLIFSSDQTGDSVPVGIIVFAVVLLIVIGVAGYMVYLRKRGEDGQL